MGIISHYLVKACFLYPILDILAVLKYLLYFSSASKFISTHPQALTIDGSQSTIWDTRVLENPCIMPSLLSSIVPNANYTS